MGDGGGGGGGGGGGIGILGLIGCGFAGFSSYTLGNPIGWVLLHTFFGWIYMLYLCGGCGGGLPYVDFWETPANEIVLEESTS